MGQNSTHNKMRFCDVDFRELVRDPKSVIRQIYSHFGYGENGQLSAEFERAIDAFMVANPRYVHGKPSYSMDEFELDAEVLRQRFELAELGTPRTDHRSSVQSRH